MRHARPIGDAPRTRQDGAHTQVTTERSQRTAKRTQPAEHHQKAESRIQVGLLYSLHVTLTAVEGGTVSERLAERGAAARCAVL